MKPCYWEVQDTFTRDGRMDEEHRFASFWKRSSKPVKNMLECTISPVTLLYDAMTHDTLVHKYSGLQEYMIYYWKFMSEWTGCPVTPFYDMTTWGLNFSGLQENMI